MVHSVGAPRGRDPLPKSIPASTGGAAGVARRPWPAARRAADAPRHDRSARTDEAPRRARRGGRRLVPLRARHRDRVPGAERSGQDDDDADARAGCWTPTRAPRRCSAARTATCPTRAAAWGSCSTPPPSTAAGAGARRSPSPRRRWGSTSGGSTRCSASSASTASAARKRVKQYSLGMRQRLGLAHALLGDPEVLILDEPANGLDPEGMRWMRELLRDFADRGGTVLLSSHLLYEVEAVADQLVIIGGGRIVAQGSREALLAGAGTLVRAADADRLLAALDAARLSRARMDDGGFVVDAEPEAVGRAALAAGVALQPPEPVRERGARAAVLRPDQRRRERRPRGGHPMSTAVLPAPVVRARRRARPGLGRLTLVELRKMTDTRSGFWLLLVTALLTVAVAVSRASSCPDGDANLLNFFAIALVPAEPAAAGRRHPRRHLGMDAAHGDDLVRARPAPLAGAAREAARGHGARARRAADLPRHRARPRRRSPARTATRRGRCRPR